MSNGGRIIELQEEVERLRAALIWCSGARDFQPDGEAREGWLKVCKPLIDAALRGQ
jgi:hypothetical protein